MQVNRLVSGQDNNRQMSNKVRCNKMCEIGCQISNKELEEESEMKQHQQHERVNKRQFQENLRKSKFNNNCSVDDNDDDMITKEKQSFKYYVDRRPSNNYDKEKTKSKYEEQFKFAERSALRNYSKSTMEDKECSAESDKNAPYRNDAAVRYDANCTPDSVSCHDIADKNDICTYSVNANGQSVLFEANIPVLIKLHEREANVRYLGVTVLAGNKSANTANNDSTNYFFQSTNVSNSNNSGNNTNGSRSAIKSSSSMSTDVITIRITDIANPFLLFELEIHEEDYISFKQRLELLVDFATFPSYLVNLLCNVQQHEIAPYKMTFTMHRGDADRATLRVIEPTQFKTVEHLSLQLIRQGDVGQKHYLAERFQYFANALACSERQRERVTQQTESEIAQLRKELHTLHDEYDAFRESTNVNAALTDKEHVTNLAHERELFHSELTQMQISYEDKLHTAERTAIEKEYKLTSNVREKEETLQQLREEKEKATTELTLLRSQLRLVEETNNAQEQELQRLRETNAELVNFKTEATRAMSTNEISYVSLTERLHAASSSLRNREDELASLRASYEKQDKYIHMLTEQNEQLKEQGKVNEQALGKTHHIISHQLETIKGIKERHKITLNQLHNERALLRDKNNTLQQVQKELASINSQLEAYTCKNSKLESELELCNEARERLSTELQQTQAALLHIQKSNVTNILSNGANNYYNNNSGVSLSNRRYGANRSFFALPLTTAFARMQSNSYPTENIPYQQNSNTHNTNNVYHRESRYYQNEENKTANYKATEIHPITTAGAIAKFSALPIVSSPASLITDNNNTNNNKNNNNDMGLTVEASTNKSNSTFSREPSNDRKLLYEYDENKNRGYNVNYRDADKVVVDVTHALINKENCNNNKKTSLSASAEFAQLHNYNDTRNNNKNSELMSGANSSVNLLEEFNKHATETQGSKNKNINGNYHFQKNVRNEEYNSSNNSHSVNSAERTAIGITCERSSADVEIVKKHKYAQPVLFAADKSHIHADSTNQMNKSTNANVSKRYTTRANEHQNASVPGLATTTTTTTTTLSTSTLSSKPPSSFVTQGSGAKTRSRPLLESKPTNFSNTCNLMQQTNSSNERQKETTVANCNMSINNLEHNQLRSNKLAAKSFFTNQRDGSSISSILQEQAVSAYF